MISGSDYEDSDLPTDLYFKPEVEAMCVRIRVLLKKLNPETEEFLPVVINGDVLGCYDKGKNNAATLVTHKQLRDHRYKPTVQISLKKI